MRERGIQLFYIYEKVVTNKSNKIKTTKNILVALSVNTKRNNTGGHEFENVFFFFNLR